MSKKWKRTKIKKQVTALNVVGKCRMLRTYLSFKINEIYDVADLDDNEVWPIQGNGGCFPIPKEYCVIDGICQDKINEDKMNNIVKAVMSQPVNPANRSQKHHIEFFRGRNNTDYRK